MSENGECITRFLQRDDVTKCIARMIDNVSVDEAGKWKQQLCNDLLANLLELGAAVAGSRRQRRTTFTVGPCVDESSTDEEEFVDAVCSDSKCHAESQVDLANLGSLPLLISKKISDDDIASLIKKLKNGKASDCTAMSDAELLHMLNLGRLKQRELECKLDGNFLRAVSLRRIYLSKTASIPLNELPFMQYDYSYVSGSCCENVVGYVPVPTGFIGPLPMNGKNYYVPMSTTEGALIASTSRGCRALRESGGATAEVYNDAMTRAPVLQCGSSLKAIKLKEWLERPQSFEAIKKVFDATSNYARLQKLDANPCGRLLYVRFEATTGDAMGMNMVSKAVDEVLRYVKKEFQEIEIVSVSGNYCVDKKAAALNWIRGRGKSVVAEATIPAAVVANVLKTSVDAMVDLAKSKLLVGSSLACTIGGWNAHAANIVAAIFIATGQDVAQLVSSSMCMTIMERTASGDLYVSCDMKCLEVGTVGGGTSLPAQRSCLKLLDCLPRPSQHGHSAKLLAKIICSTVLAGELSLIAALCSNDLVRSHLRLNRSSRLFSTELVSSLDRVSYIESGDRQNKKAAPYVQKTPLDSSLKQTNCANIL